MTADITEATVVIGMPVYNGERWLRQSVASLLAQTRQDFRLVISDNASTDATQRICRELAAADSRIRYHRNEINVGVFRNYDVAFSLARSRYFKWASCNDLCAPGYLQACIAALEADPKANLAYSATTLFSMDPGHGERYLSDPDVRDDDPVTRFRRVLAELRLNNAFNGVYRSDALRRSCLNGEYMGSDIVLVAEIALSGHVLRVPEYLFFRRMTPDAASAVKDDGSRREFFAGTGRDIQSTPALDMNRQLIHAVHRSGLRPMDRCRAYSYLGRRMWWSKAAIWSETSHILKRALG